MKVYTEVNYIWKDNKLVQTDSKSFEYEGEVELCHWYHRHSNTVSIPTVADVTDAYKGSDLDKGLTSGQAALGAGLEKIKKDNPDPNLNVQTPDKLYNKTRDLAHDAATNVKKIWDRNRPKNELPNPNDYITTTQGPDEEYEIGGSGRSGYSTLRGEGSSVESNKLRRGIPILKTLSGKAKPKG